MYQFQSCADPAQRLYLANPEIASHAVNEVAVIRHVDSTRCWKLMGVSLAYGSAEIAAEEPFGLRVREQIRKSGAYLRPFREGEHAVAADRRRLRGVLRFLLSHQADGALAQLRRIGFRWPPRSHGSVLSSWLAGARICCHPCPIRAVDQAARATPATSCQV